MSGGEGRDDRPGGRPRRALSLRARLIALVLVVAAAALVAVDVIIPLTTRAALINAKDQTLTSVVGNLRSALQNSGPVFPLENLASISESNPLGGQIGWSVALESGTTQVIVPIASAPRSNPAVRLTTPATGPSSVGDAAGGSSTYRVLGYRIPIIVRGHQQAGNVVAWVPLDDVNAAVSRLVLLELLISLGLLVLVGGIAGLVVRRELRPLETMARTADDIAAGDLTRRVDAHTPGTEVGRLGTAFNGMVDAVVGLLEERAASERRMRQFVADASHELRTPVAAIRGYTDLYRAGALPEEVALERAMDRMGFESRRMGALVEDLLTLTQTDAETAAPTDRVDLLALLTGVVDDAAVIDRSRTWRLAGTAARAVVLGDRLRLHQLFANLLGNVRTHTAVGTTATVSVFTSETEVAVAVMDDGPGVGDADLHRLFDRFFRVDPSRSRERGGSGLGLSIAAAIVRAHRGRISAGHTPGGGLTVTVVLPLAPAESAADGQAPGTRDASSAAPGAPDASTAGAAGGPSPAGASALNPAAPPDAAAVRADSPAASSPAEPNPANPDAPVGLTDRGGTSG
jgi:two-component system OmpR family sensor kinase